MAGEFSFAHFIPNYAAGLPDNGFVYSLSSLYNGLKYEKEHIIYFIRLPMNDTLRKIMEPEITSRPVGRPPKSGVNIRHFEFHYRAGSWKKRRRVVCEVEWHNDELFP